MATYTLRCTMQLVTSPASLSVKYLQNRSGVRFAQPFLVGLPHGFLFTLALRRSYLRSISYHYSYWESVLGRRPCTERSKQPSQIHAGLRCLGDSPGDGS